MLPMSDPQYLSTKQYKSSDNLNARANLYRLFSTNPYRWMRWVYDQINLVSGAMVLEVGAGHGMLWQENIDRIVPNVSICISDLSYGMMTEARFILCSDARFNFSNLDVQAIPFRSGEFDLIIANHMLYHVPDLSLAIRELARVINPHGRLIVATNGIQHLQELHAIIHEFEQRYPNNGDPGAICFGLNNASELLGQEFSDLETHHYMDELYVTAAQPLVDYIASSLFWDMLGGLNQRRYNELMALVSQKILSTGGIRITKDTGIIIVRHPRR